MAKRKPAVDKKDKDLSAHVQLGFRLPRELYDRLDLASERLGLDISGILRMILIECLPEYEARAEKAALRRNE